MSDLKKIQAEAEFLRSALTELNDEAGERAFSEDEQTRYDEGKAALVERNELIARYNEVSDLAVTPANVRSGSFEAPAGIVRENAFDLSGLSVASTDNEYRSTALRAIEAAGGISDGERDQVEKVVRGQGREVALRVALTSSPEYREAFAIAATRGLASASDEQVRLLDRAASLTPAEGGYAVPTTFDPTLIQTNTRSTNSFRQVSRVVQTSTDQWSGVSSAGVAFSWDAEAAEVSDDAPTLTQPSIAVHKGAGFVPFSIEIGGDWANIEADLRSEFMIGKDKLEGAAFTTGSGSGQPTGIITALDGTSSEIAPTTAEVFALADVYKTEQALAAQYRANATVHANKVIYNTIRQFDTAGGAGLWERVGAGQPAELLGYPAYEASDMDSVLPDAAATADNFLLVIGDFSNYVIVDRVGVSVELVPHLFNTSNNLPSGQRGLYCWFRVGADSVNDAAFAMLSVPTAA